MHLAGQRRSAGPDAAARGPQRQTDAIDGGIAVLGFLAEHGLSPTPGNYELGFLNRFDRDSTVAKAIDALLIAGDRISQEDADRIMLAHALHRARHLQQVGDPAEREEMRRQTLRLADIAADAAAATSDFGRDIGHRMVELVDDGVRSAVTTMLADTLRTEQRLLAASREIDQLREDVAAARSDAKRDALTGLLNRRGAEAEFAPLREAREPVAIAVLDIDHFKRVNDRFGHPVGDRVLRAIAAELADRCAPYAVVRWGGEEFLAILDGLDLPRATAFVEAACAAVAAKTYRLRDTDQPLGQVTLSAGVASSETGDVDAAMRAADTALYAAKQDGRNRVIAAS